MNLRPAVEADLDALAALAESAQTDPRTWSNDLSDVAADIAAEIQELAELGAPWPERVLVAADGDDVVGWIAAEPDDEMGRLWWWGPVVAAHRWADVAVPLFAAARRQLTPDGIDEEELVGDARSDLRRDLAAAHGFATDPGSVALVRPGTEPVGAHPTTATIGPLDPSWSAGLAALHDATFPGSHRQGRGLEDSRDDRHRLLIATDGGALVGYVAHELQHDGSGYIDFLGVVTAHRNAGLGRALVAAAVDELVAIGATHTHLTVRSANAPARHLYAAVGFTEDRELIPYRLGFTLP